MKSTKTRYRKGLSDEDIIPAPERPLKTQRPSGAFFQKRSSGKTILDLELAFATRANRIV